MCNGPAAAQMPEPESVMTIHQHIGVIAAHDRRPPELNVAIFRSFADHSWPAATGRILAESIKLGKHFFDVRNVSNETSRPCDARTDPTPTVKTNNWLRTL
jgi:hypothetical protein